MIGIYKITNNINGKSYIGQSIHCGKRLDEHYKGNQLIDETIKIEGIENFTFQILKEVEKEDLSYWEDYYIYKFNTLVPNGYNKRLNNKGEIVKLIKAQTQADTDNSITQLNTPAQPIKTNKIKLDSTICFLQEIYKKLSKKDLLVFFYLIGVSINQDNTFIVDKNELIPKQVYSFLKISKPTYYTAIKELKSNGYMNELEDCYIIEIPISIDIEQIRTIYKTDIENKYLSCMLLLYLHTYESKIGKSILTRKNIIDKLGLSSTNPKTYKDLVDCLQNLKALSLINFTTETVDIGTVQIVKYIFI